MKTKAPTPKEIASRWPGVSVALERIRDLIPNVRNARVHSDEQVALIADAMLKRGYTNPILRDEANVIWAGHGRLLGGALNVTRGHAEFEWAPVIVARGWSDEEKRAYALFDNQIALRAGWDTKLLAAELQELSGVGIDLGSLGFGADELRALRPRRPGEDLAEPPPEKPIVAVGELWILGGHRLFIGDCTKELDVAHAMDVERPHLMVTDPPYGVSYDPAWRTRALGQRGKKTGKVTNDDRADWTPAWQLFGGDVAYVWHGGLHGETVQRSLATAGLEVRAQIIWAKDRFALSRGNFHWRHEPAFYAVRRGRPSHWRGGRKKDTIWRIPELPSRAAAKLIEIVRTEGVESTVWEVPVTVDGQGTGHGTQKPVECMRRPIVNNSEAGEFIYDPFVGSGTTLIAAETEGRRCIAMEIDPGYAESVIRRWEKFTGEIAKREDGATLAKIGKGKK